MAADRVLVIDLGTHKATAALMDSAGSIVASAESPRYPTHRDHPGWAEQDPGDWWDAVVHAIRGLSGTEHPPRGITGVITVGHGPSHLPIGSDLQPLGRSLIWQDTRARSEAAWISAHTTTEERFGALGFHVPIAPGMGPAKILWLRDNEPERYTNTVAIIQPKDYITLKLTGELGSDRYGMKDIAHAETGEFSEWYAERLGLRRDIVPRVSAPWTVIGYTTGEQERATGLPAGIPVGCGTVDAFSGLIGSGGQDAGDICDISGTSEIIGLIRAAPAAPFEGFLCYPLVNDASVVFGVTRAAGDSIDWYIRRIARTDDVATWFRDFEERQRDAQSSDAAPVLFWPYLDGERSPLWNADLRGMFVGLDMTSDADTMARAVFEGIAMSVRHNIELLSERTGTMPKRMWVGGGTARSQFFNQIKADVTGLDVYMSREYNSTVRGARAMMDVALGRQPDVLTAVRTLIGTPRVIRPRDEWCRYYDRLMDVYRRVPELMTPIHASLATIRRDQECIREKTTGITAQTD